MRPLPHGGSTWVWQRHRVSESWTWCRVYHRSVRTPQGHHARSFGPISRFDPHRPDEAGRGRVDPDDRSVIYVGTDLATSLCEVFGAVREAQLCPRWRVAVLEPLVPVRLYDLCAPGAAMAIGALPALANGDVDRRLSQAWSRAIYEDQPAAQPVSGVHYRSAYNGDVALALWDAAEHVQTASASGGTEVDLALVEPAMLDRVRVACASRHIDVEIIPSVQCGECSDSPDVPLG